MKRKKGSKKSSKEIMLRIMMKAKAQLLMAIPKSKEEALKFWTLWD